MAPIEHMPQKKAVITLRDVSFSFHNQLVLDQVNLDIYEHESVCVVGPNGGGKSTLMKIVIGLLIPERGNVTVLGGNPVDSRLQVGYVPQYANYDPLFPISVQDVVRMGRLGSSFTGRYRRDDREAALHALDEIGLADLAGRPFASLSGGQRQRVLIARALVADGRILVLDEPTANIDPSSEEQLFNILTELNKKMTILLVTHDVGFASQFFERIVCVNRRVVIHPTSEVTGSLISEIYGSTQHMIRHDRHCIVEEHRHG